MKTKFRHGMLDKPHHCHLLYPHAYDPNATTTDSNDRLLSPTSRIAAASEMSGTPAAGEGLFGREKNPDHSKSRGNPQKGGSF